MYCWQGHGHVKNPIPQTWELRSLAHKDHARNCQGLPLVGVWMLTVYANLRFVSQWPVCAKTSNWQLPTPDVYRLLACSPLLLRLANIPRLHAVYSKYPRVGGCCSWRASIRVLTAHLTPHFLYVCLSFLHCLAVPVSFRGSSHAGHG